MLGNSSTNCNKCKDGYFLEEGKCKACAEDCLSCTSLANCSKCKVGLYWNTETFKCISGLAANCDKYSSNGATCLTCSTGFYSIQNMNKSSTCKQLPIYCEKPPALGECNECFPHYYFSSSGKCAPILVQNCTSSDDGSSCKKCDTGFFLQKVCSPSIYKCAESMPID